MEQSTRQLNLPKGHPRLVDNCLMYFYQFLTWILILKEQQLFKILYFFKFTNPFRKKITCYCISQSISTMYIVVKSPRNVQNWNIPKHGRSVYVGWAERFFDCLKCKGDICIKTIIPSQNKAFVYSSQLQNN